MADEDSVSVASECGEDVIIKAKRKTFKWTPKMIEDLITSVESYKSAMEFKNLDFDADKSAQYVYVREAMAKIYQETDESFFGPVKAPLLPQNINELSKIQQVDERKKFKKKTETFKRAKNRIMEKTKEIRQAFSKAVISGSRSGSGKVVFEHYDNLVKVWGGSATSKPLNYGISSSCSTIVPEIEASDDEDSNNFDGKESKENVDTSTHHPTSSEDETDDNSQVHLLRKRKVENVVPKLIDNKRKHLEKSLSAAQRDQILVNDMKRDAEFRHNLVEIMRESNENFANSIKEISKSMADLSKGLCNSMQLLSHTLASQVSPPQFPMQHQNIFYQQYQQQNHQSGSYEPSSKNDMFYTNLLNDGK